MNKSNDKIRKAFNLMGDKIALEGASNEIETEIRFSAELNQGVDKLKELELIIITQHRYNFDTDDKSFTRFRNTKTVSGFEFNEGEKAFFNIISDESEITTKMNIDGKSKLEINNPISNDIFNMIGENMTSQKARFVLDLPEIESVAMYDVGLGTPNFKSGVIEVEFKEGNNTLIGTVVDLIKEKYGLEFTNISVDQDDINKAYDQINAGGVITFDNQA